MVKINKFNENKNELTIEILRETIDNTFAFIMDDNKVQIINYPSEVAVNITSILPSNVIYNNIDEYSTKHELWSETLLDINVAIKQIINSGGVGYNIEINTVGNVKIIFYLKNDKLFKILNNSVIISKVNLIEALSEFNIKNVLIDTNILHLFIGTDRSNEEVQLIKNKLVELFPDFEITYYTKDRNYYDEYYLFYKLKSMNGRRERSFRLWNSV